MDRVKMVNSSPSASYDSDDDHVNKKSNEKDHRDEVLKASPSTSERNKDSCTLKQGEEIESTKAELGEAMDENQRLKKCVDQIMKDYEALKRKFSELQSKEQMDDDNKMEKHDNDLVSLSLWRTSSQDFNKKFGMNNNKLSANIITSNEKQNGLQEDRSLALALDGKVEASKPINFADKKQGLVRNSSLSSNDNANANGNRNGNGNGDDERALQPHIKKPRVSVRARCDTPTMNDGCQWRKYGQKIAKGNPCPRAYYRCTVAPSCPVRKQVQRCVEDMSILITTYEGAHNHPLPLSAAAMASTTSAATYMSMSESSTSSNQGLPSYQLTTPTTAAPFEEYLHGNLKSNIPTKPYSFYHAPNHPTITLDLTNQENKIPLNNHESKQSFAQSISQSIDNSKNTILPSWTNGLHNYGEQPYMNGVHQVRPLNIVTLKHSASHQNCSNNIVTDSNQVLVPDTITQAAKVLTSDPSFQSFLTAALSSFIGGKS